VLDDIDELFAVERMAKSFEELKKLRGEKSGPLVDKIKAWLFEHHQLSRAESTLRAAIEYSMKLWHGLTVFLENVNVPLSNNEAERTIRHSVVGRKNYYGSRNHNGSGWRISAHPTRVCAPKKILTVNNRQFRVVTCEVGDEDPDS